jgi:hypothetical protein
MHPFLGCVISRPVRPLKTPNWSHCVGRASFATLLVWAMLTTQGCATTAFHQREKLNDRSMQFDQDGGLTYLRQKIEAAREGGLGGFGSAEAGGCGCQ